MEAGPKLAGCDCMDRAVRCDRCDRRAARASRRSPWSEAIDGQADPGKSMNHSAAFLKLVDDAKSRVREVSVDEARRRLEDGTARLIDVREDNEWQAEHVLGAEHLGRGVIERDIESRIPD